MPLAIVRIFNNQWLLLKKFHAKQKRGKDTELLPFFLCILFYATASLRGINKAYANGIN